MKKFLLLILVCLIQTSCDQKFKNKNLSFDNLFTKINEIPVPDSLQISEFIISTRYGNADTLFISEFFSNSLFLIDLNDKKIQMVGRPGQGPGEYTAAYDFQYINSILYFNDRYGNFLKSINFKTGEKKQQQTLHKLGWRKFIKFGTSLYIYKEKSGYYIYDNKGHEYFKVPKIFQQTKALYDNYFISEKNRIYFMNKYEGIINELDLTSGEEKSLKIKGLKHVYNWSKDYNNTVKESFFDAKTKKNYTFSSINVIHINRRPFFLVSTYKNDRSNARLLILDQEGVVVFNVDAEKKYPLACFEDKIFMYSSDEFDRVTFYEFLVKSDQISKTGQLNE